MDDRPRPRSPAWLVAAVVLPLLVGFLLFAGPTERALGSADGLSALRRQGPVSGWFGAGLLALDLLLPIPSTGVMAVLGELHGPWAGGAFAALGSIGGGLLGYGIVRWLGMPAARRFVGEVELQRMAAFFERRGVWAIALSRVLPLVPEVLVCLAALAGMRVARFALALAAGTLPLAFAVAWFGAAGADRPLLTAALAMGVPLLLLPLGLIAIRRGGDAPPPG